MDMHQEALERLADTDPSKPKVPWYRREFKVTARIAAAYLLPVGVAGMWWNYHLIHTRGEYYPKIAFIAPVCLVFGAFFLLFPNEDPTAKPVLRNLRLRHWVAFVAALAAAIANWYALRHGVYP